ncbi:hypothetical protein HY990_04450 [Candidatus Micrarchaeota archaeon]|nr:hypothetical protein [Candidatus Micrarchaeota archaeon]
MESKEIVLVVFFIVMFLGVMIGVPYATKSNNTETIQQMSISSNGAVNVILGGPTAQKIIEHGSHRINNPDGSIATTLEGKQVVFYKIGSSQEAPSILARAFGTYNERITDVVYITETKDTITASAVQKTEQVVDLLYIATAVDKGKWLIITDGMRELDMTQEAIEAQKEYKNWLNEYSQGSASMKIIETSTLVPNENQLNQENIIEMTKIIARSLG